LWERYFYYFDSFSTLAKSLSVVITDRDNALINVVEKVFPDATTLLCSYHIGQNVRAKCKLDCKVKDLKGKNGEAIKPVLVVKTVMTA